MHSVWCSYDSIMKIEIQEVSEAGGDSETSSKRLGAYEHPGLQINDIHLVLFRLQITVIEKPFLWLENI